MLNKPVIFSLYALCFFYLTDLQKNISQTGQIKALSDTIKLVVPIGGNSWVTVKAVGGNEKVTENGWSNWKNPEAVFSTYFKIEKAGDLYLYALLNVPDGESVIECIVNNIPKEISVSGKENREYFLGSWNIPDPGYIKIDMKGLKRTGKYFANVRELQISGSAVDSNTAYVKNDEGNYFYWGRRGPSVHINYDTAESGNDAEWFYNEITVPEGNDVIGSYFMADGFKEGYFGMQVNSSTERRILFSVWSPFQTDDPKNIPEDKKIILIKRGKDVHAGEFGNEGAGGQSYLNYNWKAGVTYGFLLHAQLSENDHTIFTAYFFTPETKKWNLIAGFSRPVTHTYLKHLHSFLENFEPSTGYITRKAYYGNQWVRSSKGDWMPITKMFFTGDATAQKGYRMDYGGGVEDNKFFLRNCGFFNDNTKLRTPFVHKTSSTPPSIDFSSLE
ncbi:MAG: DUF3472 domain-containing protein [Bacteroidetes bacterium]|nr:DUF3472 domain-containing protein [Bacteroidota bacterium]MBS1931111.1 DUF3472 domain-containing protein [Bacteroidota bacterium]